MCECQYDTANSPAIVVQTVQYTMQSVKTKVMRSMMHGTRTVYVLITSCFVSTFIMFYVNSYVYVNS